MTSRIDRPVRSIAYCALFVRELLDANVIGHATNVLLRDDYQYKNKLEQSSALYVRGGLEVEEDWLFTSVLVTIVLRRVNHRHHKQFIVQFVREVLDDQET